MLNYLILVFLWSNLYLFFKWIDKKNEKKRVKLYFSISSGFLLFLIMGLKHYSVGTDVAQYLTIFSNSSNVFSREVFNNSEWGFGIINISLKKIGFSSQGYILAMALLISSCFTWFFYKYSNNIYISFLLHLTIGMFTMSMSGIRQTLAVCLTLFAFKYMRENKIIIYFLLIFSAYIIHNSAIIFFPIYFLRNLNISKKSGYTLLLFTISLLFFREYLTPLLDYFMPERYSYRYELLVQDNYVNPILILIALIVPLISLFFWNYVEKLDQSEKKIFSNLFILSCINLAINILSLNSIMMGRLSFYFLTYNVVLISNVISVIKNKKLVILGVYSIFIISLLYFVFSSIGGVYSIDNYKFFWQSF